MYHFHVADDHPLFRNALNEVIKQHYPDAVVVQSMDLDGTMRELEKNAETDLLLLDLHMPGSQDLFGLITVRDKFSGIPVAIISADEDVSTISRAMGHGASGYIPKSCSPQVIHQAIASILDGNRWVPEEYRNSLMPVTAEEKDLAQKIATLTPQQYRVLCYLREGWLNKQIGYELGVTEATIKAHITAIFRKLGTSNRTQAVIMLSKMSLHDEQVSAGPGIT
ncbi:MAG: response regulator transcription factor [Gammaproteobacteria bacterium]|nr:response regulator transcription factor [Gammaproteobacteria bacterium]